MIRTIRSPTKSLPANAKIRVLVVDDSVVIRRLVSHALMEDNQLEVVGSAPNGAIALQRISQLKPDLVTLDVEMPEMGGLEALRQIRPLYPDMPVIMFSTLTARGADATIEALSLGASDYVTKAANVGSLDQSMASLRQELIPKIKQFFRIGVPEAPLLPKIPVSIRPSPAGRVNVVAIGCSTGGPNALATVLPMFPKAFSLPILIVQHMPALFTKLLADRLNVASEIQVEEAAEGSPVVAGKALLAPGGYHMRLRKYGAEIMVTLDQEPPENSCRPAVDVTLRSIAAVYGGAVITAILTGMGHDGLRGAQALKELGAHVIAQDQASSVVWGMPGSIVSAGIANSVVDVFDVVPEILRQVKY